MIGIRWYIFANKKGTNIIILSITHILASWWQNNLSIILAIWFSNWNLHQNLQLCMLVGSILSLPVRNRAMKNSFNSKLLYFTKNQPEAPFHRLKDQFSLEILPLLVKKSFFHLRPPSAHMLNWQHCQLRKKRSRHRNPPKKPLCNSPTESPTTPHEIPSPTEQDWPTRAKLTETRVAAIGAGAANNRADSKDLSGFGGICTKCTIFLLLYFFLLLLIVFNIHFQIYENTKCLIEILMMRIIMSKWVPGVLSS